MAGRKRKNIQFLLIRLTKDINQLAESVFDLLPKEDVRVALQDRHRSSLTATVPADEDNEIKNIDSKANGENPNAEHFVNDGIVNADSVLDQEANIEIDE